MRQAEYVKTSKYMRWRRLRRLHEMQPFENAFVPFGANKRIFAVRKQAGETMRTLPKLEAIEAAAVKLGEILTVLKTGGQLDEAATTQVENTLDGIADLILPTMQATEQEQRTLKEVLDAVRREMKNFSVEAQSADYALSDRADAILADIEVAAQMASAPTPTAAPAEPAEPIEPVEPVEAAPEVEPAAPAQPAVEPAAPIEPAEAAPAEPAAEDLEAAPAEPAPAEATPAEPTVAPETPSEAPEEPSEAPAYATKEDLTALSKMLTDTLKEALKPVLELKAQIPAMAPTTQPIYAAPPKVSIRSALEEFDMAMSPDLDQIDEYGNYKA